MKNFFRVIFSLLFSVLIFSSFASHKKQAKDDVFTVVLDAGHGGHDPGKVAYDGKKRHNEKDVALQIVLLVGKELEKNPNIKVVYTRKTDVFVDLFKRGQIANKAKADLFVSVHCNAHSSQAYGSETYVLGLHANKQNFEVAKAENEVIYLEENHEINYAGYDISSPESFIGLEIEQEEFLDQSILLAKIIQDNFTINLNRKNRGVKSAGFIVLHQTYMPSVLIETGFITNKNERRYLLSKDGQGALARNIVRGIMSYKKYIDENVGENIDFEIKNDILEETTEVALPVKNNTGSGTHHSEEVEQIVESVVAGSPVVENNSGNEPIQNQEAIKKVTENENRYDQEFSFKVQIAASSSKIELKSYNFKGLDPVSREQGDDFYRYFYGQPHNYPEALELKDKAVQAGYTTSYIVAYKNGKKVSLAEALKSDSN
ncbi:N-acetylmuramoyl-L-alanine amidase family protein [Abyssalbus ytuae]|uniref:N-acetylmuramoyl-L-alanine amidase n=1 Tax=Abyssalbus ytuae TaxID=2926907 RepID=A0A9E6ZPK8_9FLAO|nr:N-acetylmuramoyl-L-alanine amidase [Abyssalbus ytuae]UOB18210.1 N-acetylmuramoyl-L-alanine amidase [Abyssalbus ytuae]